MLLLEELESIINNISDGIVLMSLEGTVLKVNDVFSQMFGYPKDVIIGQKSVFLQLEGQHVMEQMLSGQKVSGIELERRHSSGKPVFIRASFSPVINQNGKLSAVSAIVQDITASKVAEFEHQAIKLQLKSFIQHNFDAIVLFDLQMNLIDANPAAEALYGWTKEEYRRCSAFDLIVPPELVQEREQLVQNVLSGTPVIGIETQRIRKDGKVIHISLSLSPIMDSFGKVVGISSIARDISERKRTEELLVQSEKLSVAGLLAAGIAHEIRNPLTSLKGFTQLLLEASGPVKQSYLDIMTNELNRIEQIVNELLVLAKPQPVLLTEADFSQIMQDVIQLLKSEAVMRRIELICDLNKATILCNAGQLKQVLVNLLKNGMEAMPGGGRIDISLAHSEEQVILELKDQGIGMSLEQLAKIGSPFYTTKDKGTGLGLMISQKIIREHQGTLTFDSQIGVGTTVRITLPAVRNESLQQACS